MDKTPTNRSKKSLINRGGTSVPKVDTPTTPSNLPIGSDLDDGPLYFPSTQESNEAIEVLWDWNSPQQKHQRMRAQKRLLPMPSPKNPIKRHPSNNDPRNFDKLREELRALQAELAMPDDDSILCLSPQQEAEFQSDSEHFDDPFNDSIDDQLLMLSQKFDNDREEKCDDKSGISRIVKKYVEDGFSDDSLDEALGAINENELKEIGFTQITQKKVEIIQNDNFIHTASGKMELHRTHSFEMATATQKVATGNLSQSVIDEIERKRLEALAKRNAKQKALFSSNSTQKIISQVRCSPEEIEKKRLQALARLENKRITEMIERNRQEAIKRLQKNRQKSAASVKSSLGQRLNCTSNIQN